jgi:hypothetical protein
MAGQKFNSERIERRPDGGNLVQDIDAIPVVFDHPLDPSDLTGDPIGPTADAFSGSLEHGYTYTRYMYIASGDDDFRRGRMYFVPEGQHDRSQARSAWDSVPRMYRPVGYGMIGRGQSQRYFS